MRDGDIKRFGACLAAITEVWQVDLSQATQRLYWNALADLTIDEVERGLQGHMRDPRRGHFKPTPADIIRQARGITDDVALRAWSKFYSAIRRNFGRYVCLDDPVIHAVIQDMGGTSAIFGGLESNIPFAKKEFCERYIGYLSRGERPTTSSALGHCQGRCENDEVLLIGDETKALSVFDQGTDRDRFLRPELGAVPRLVLAPTGHDAATD